MTCQKCKGLMVKEWRPEFSQEVGAPLYQLRPGPRSVDLAESRDHIACQGAGSEGGVIIRSISSACLDGADDWLNRLNWASVDVALVVRPKTPPIKMCDLKSLSLAAARRPPLP